MRKNRMTAYLALLLAAVLAVSACQSGADSSTAAKPDSAENAQSGSQAQTQAQDKTEAAAGEQDFDVKKADVYSDDKIVVKATGDNAVTGGGDFMIGLSIENKSDKEHLYFPYIHSVNGIRVPDMSGWSVKLQPGEKSEDCALVLMNEVLALAGIEKLGKIEFSIETDDLQYNYEDVVMCGLTGTGGEGAGYTLPADGQVVMDKDGVRMTYLGYIVDEYYLNYYICVVNNSSDTFSMENSYRENMKVNGKETQSAWLYSNEREIEAGVTAIMNLSTDIESIEKEAGVKLADIKTIEEKLEMYFGDTEYEQELPISITMEGGKAVFTGGEAGYSADVQEQMAYDESVAARESSKAAREEEVSAALPIEITGYGFMPADVGSYTGARGAVIVYNPNESILLKNPSVTVSLLDEKGDAVIETVAGTGAYVLPKTYMPLTFNELADSSREIKSIAVEVDNDGTKYAATMTEFENGETSNSGYLDDKLSFEVSGVGDSGDFIHSIDVKGVLHNAGEEMNFATVKVVFYDADGNLMCGAYKSIDSIPANGDVEVQFHTGLHGEENPFDHYEVYVFRGTA